MYFGDPSETNSDKPSEEHIHTKTKMLNTASVVIHVPVVNFGH